MQDFDKYGVVLEPDSIKIAAAEGRPCPSCGSRNVNYRGLTPICPNCGCAPWESQNGRNKTQRDFQR